MSESRPNFVFILTDQQRRDSLGCYGNPVIQTPQLDALASEGVLYDRAFVANVVCSPSRASIFTGRYPQAHGLVTNGMRLVESEVTIPQALAASGYRTAAVGKIHLAPHQDTDPKMAGPEANYQSPESIGFWQAGKPFPLPYYGFEQVRVCNGHGSDYTDYYRDLCAADPKLPELFKSTNSLTPPSGAPSSWKSALPEEHHSTTWVADQVIGILEQYARSTQPFFLFAGIPDPHAPYCPPAPWCDMYDPADVPLPHRHLGEIKNGSNHYVGRIEEYAGHFGFHPTDMPEAYIREIIAHTYGMVSLLDKHVGRIVHTLERLGLRERTIVIFSSDHGEHLGDHWFIYKVVPYEELFRVPLIWSCPDRFGARRQSGIVSHVDLMPTILDLAAAQMPHGIQGVSYRQGLEDKGGQDFAGRPFAYVEDDDSDGERFARTLRTDRFRLTYYLPQEEGDLFDLEKDPHELENRWKDPNYGNIRNEMVQRLLTATIQAADPKPIRYCPV